jgi:DNA-binding NtrC family response regulator
VFLVIDPPEPEAISTRKLVLETAKYNVLTAFTAKEGAEILRSHPVNAVVVHTRIMGGGVAEFIRKAKQLRPEAPVITISPQGNVLDGADHAMSSHDPVSLVDLLAKLFGVPTATGEVEASEVSAIHDATKPV